MAPRSAHEKVTYRTPVYPEALLMNPADAGAKAYPNRENISEEADIIPILFRPSISAIIKGFTTPNIPHAIPCRIIDIPKKI